MKWYSFKIYEHDHFYRQYEDRKNNLYMLNLNKELEDWLDNNIKEEYSINCDDHCNDPHRCNYMYIEFTEITDAMAFKIYWELDND